MTENLAGRGGGLRERIIAAMKRAWPKTKIASYNGVILELEKLCREIALEAAAPPSTPDDDLVQCARCQKMSQVVLVETGFAGEREPLCGPCISIERFAADDAIQAALATPSTQSPPYHCTYCDGNHLEEVCPQRCVSDLANDLGRAARELHEQMACLGRCPDRADYAAAFKPILPAATQEPAGSVQVVTDLQVALRIVGDWKEDSRGLVHVHKDAIRKAIVAALRSAGNCGSPRKVGEDEAQTFEQWWQAEGAHMVRTTHRTGYELMREAWNAALPRAKEQQKELRVKSHPPSVSGLQRRSELTFHKEKS